MGKVTGAITEEPPPATSLPMVCIGIQQRRAVLTGIFATQQSLDEGGGGVGYMGCVEWSGGGKDRKRPKETEREPVKDVPWPWLSELVKGTVVVTRTACATIHH